MATDNRPAWAERMATARFGSFEFKTDSHETKYGRRLVVHEFPGGDMPVVEDLGKKAGEWRLNAYFIGWNYDQQRDAFLELLNAQGADWLTHPWLGLLWVRPRTWSIHESNDKGGYCTITVEFVHGGQTDNAPTADAVDKATGSIQVFRGAVVDDFALEPMSADGMTAFISAVHQKLEVLRQVIALATLPLTWASQVKGLIAGIKGDLSTLTALPAAYASAFRGLTDALGGGADSSDFSDTARPRVVARVATTKSTVKLSGVAATDGAVRRNLQRESALQSRLLVTAAAQVALADYRAEGDRDAALASVVSALDALLPSLPDVLFQAAVAARTALIEALMAQDLKPATMRDVVAPLPSVVLAHRLGVDEDVFLARNAVRHPLFVRGRVYG